MTEYHSGAKVERHFQLPSSPVFRIGLVEQSRRLDRTDARVEVLIV